MAAGVSGKQREAKRWFAREEEPQAWYQRGCGQERGPLAHVKRVGIGGRAKGKKLRGVHAITRQHPPEERRGKPYEQGIRDAQWEQGEGNRRDHGREGV